MSRTPSLDALRNANPRLDPTFDDAVDAAATDVLARIETAVTAGPPLGRKTRPRPRLIGLSAAGLALAAATGVTAFFIVAAPGVGPGVENAAAAIKKAATLTAASADRSGQVTVRITHDGQLWAGKTVHWNGDDVEITDDGPGRPSSGLPLIVVDGMMYSHDPCCDGWVELGPVSGIDPGTGTTPTEILAAVREDLGGTTLRRITASIAVGGLTTIAQPNGSTVYSGKVAAGEIARESGFKEGQAIRVFPFGFVAQDAAADPASLLDTAITVGADGVIREIAVDWGTWIYSVTYTHLGSTQAVVAPAGATPIQRVTTTDTP